MTGALRFGMTSSVRRSPIALQVMLTLALVLGLAACATPQLAGPTDPPVRSILFLGNSLTYYNDLPAMVEDAAQAAGFSLRIGSVALPNVAVIDHADGLTAAREAIAAQRWDLVVLQQGPTPEGICRDTLVLGAAKLAPLVRDAGGTVAVLAPWTRITVPGFLPEARRSAVLAANAVNGKVLLVGDAWRLASERDASLALHSSDGYHPAATGSWLAALLIVEQLFEPPAGWLATPPEGVDPLSLSTLREAARDAAIRADSLKAFGPPPRSPLYPGPC
jgi:hypothetical protein